MMGLGGGRKCEEMIFQRVIKLQSSSLLKCIYLLFSGYLPLMFMQCCTWSLRQTTKRLWLKIFLFGSQLDCEQLLCFSVGHKSILRALFLIYEMIQFLSMPQKKDRIAIPNLNKTVI